MKRAILQRRADHDAVSARKQLPPKYQAWVDARNPLRLSHAQIQMASELGMNSKKLGQKANHRQEP
jgi:hypothetical protein